MPGVNGLEIIEQLQLDRPYLPVILLTAYHTTEAAIRATRLGASVLLKVFPVQWFYGGGR